METYIREGTNARKPSLPEIPGHDCTSERTGFISAHAHMLAMSTKMFCLTDLEAHAEKTLSELASNFFKTGSNDETSLRWNTEAFQRSALYQATVQLGSWYIHV